MSLPTWTRALIRRLAPADRAEDLLGDLEEVHRERLRLRSSWVATLLTAAEVVETATALVVARARGRGRRRDRPRSESPGRLPFSWVDVKLGLRMLRKYPLLTGVSIVPMAVAVAAAAGVHAVTAHILHPRLPFPEGDRVVGIENWNVATGSADGRALHDYITWRRELTSVADLGAFETYRPNLIHDEGPAESLFGSRISAAAFRVTRVPPLLGRPLLDEDELPGAPDVAVIGYDLWRSRFGGDPGVLGRAIRLGESTSTIVGVMPRGFAFPYNDQIWVPLRDDKEEWEPLEGPWIYVFGRLRDGADLEDVQAELDGLGARAAAVDPEAYQSIRARVVPYGTNLWGGSTLSLAGLRIALVLLLLVVCSTVGVLVFVRNLSREAEVTMRFFLGAGRGRIVAQLFTEALVMASVASLLGVILMFPGLRWVYATATSAMGGEGGLPFWVRAQPATGTLYYVAALTLLSAGLAGLLPSLTLTRRRGHSPFERVTSGGSTIRIGPKGTIAVACQTALTVGLLVLAIGLWPTVVGGFRQGDAIDASRYLVAEYRPGDVPATNEEKDQLLRRVLESSMGVATRLVADPRVTGVTLGSSLPGQRARQWGIEVEGHVDDGDVKSAHLAWVDSGYFQVLDIPVLAGRTFEPADLSGGGTSPPVAIVNRSFARKWFGEQSPLGRRVRFVGAISAFPGDPAQHSWAEVVGVVGDVGMSLRYPTSPEALYLPLRTGTYPMGMAVRAIGNPVDLGSTLRATSTEADPWLRLSGATTLKRVVDGAQAAQRTVFAAVALATLTALALSLSAVYAVVSFLVGRRTREIGIRIALGGRPSRVVGGILSHALRQLAFGIAAGIALVSLLRILGLTSTSWEALLVGAGATIAAGFTAGLVPALRAVSVHPTVAIRTER